MALTPVRKFDKQVAEALGLYSEIHEKNDELYGTIKVFEADSQSLETAIVPRFSTQDGALEEVIEAGKTELFSSVEQFHDWLGPNHNKNANQKSRAIVQYARGQQSTK